MIDDFLSRNSVGYISFVPKCGELHQIQCLSSLPLTCVLLDTPDLAGAVAPLLLLLPALLHSRFQAILQESSPSKEQMLMLNLPILHVCTHSSGMGQAHLLSTEGAVLKVQSSVFLHTKCSQ